MYESSFPYIFQLNYFSLVVNQHNKSSGQLRNVCHVKKTQRGKIFFLLSYSFKYKHLTNLIFSFQSVIFQCPPLIEISDLLLENFCLFVCCFLYTKGSLIQDYQFRQIRIIRTSFHSIKRRPMSTDTSSNVHGNNTLHL